MNPSRRHHYLPQFYIKNFLNKQGVLHVYNKKLGVFNTKKLAPKSIFFEWDRNTVEVGGKDSDSFERLYAKLDQRFSSAISNVLQTNLILPENIIDIHLFSSFLRWRVPANDKVFDKIKDQFPYEKLPYKINIGGADDATKKAALEHLVSSDLFNSQKRFIFPFLPFYSKETLLNIGFHSFLNSDSSQKGLIGDFPIIDEEKLGPNEMSNFILPLSSTDTFIYKIGVKNAIRDSAFYFYKDLSIFHLANKYVASKDRAHLELIVKTYEKMKSNNNAHKIIRLLFETI